MDINILAVIVATVLQFMAGALWYGPLFGKMWMKIHHCDGLSKEELAKMQKEIMPYYGLQFLVTLVTTVILGILIKNLPQYSAHYLAFLLWLGFIVPTQISAIMFGNDEKKWFVQKTSIMAGAAFACVMIAATVFSMMR
ncbi:DUF1761 domain-containing protein [soil metagenome]